MCVLVKVPSGLWISTIGQFRESVPADIVLHKCYSEVPPDHCCLCAINLDASVEPLGWAAKVDNDGDVVIVDESQQFAA